MRKIFFILGLTVILASPLLANHSLNFSTKLDCEYAWQITRVNNEWQMSFANDCVVVDDSDPADAVLLDDFVNLPTMTLTAIVDKGSFIEAVLAPTGPLTIDQDSDSSTHFTASLKNGGSVYMGTTFLAFSSPKDDLDVTSYTPGYSLAIDHLAEEESNGALLDLSFTGDAAQGKNLYAMIKSETGSAQGTLSGQINAVTVPAPAGLLLGSIGVGLVGWLRRRRAM